MNYEKIENPTEFRSRIRASLLAGAIGDALGAPIEFMTLEEIRDQYGHRGLQEFVPAYGRLGSITDDTQMTLFTAEGVIRGWVRGLTKGISHVPTVVWHAYHRWLHTQGVPWPEVAALWFEEEEPDGWLIGEEFLFSRRAPGNTCLSALRSGKMGTLEERLNDSKGCGGVMRVAPAGMVNRTPEECFELGLETAALTHSHPTGFLAAGFLAAVIRCVLEDVPLDEALDVATRKLEQYDDHRETLAAVQAARRLALEGDPSAETVEQLGQGWIAEEALAISVYCALVSGSDLRAALTLAVNHSGDSDSTGCITGHLMGAMLGEAALPEDLLEQVEGRETIEQLAADLAWIVTDGFDGDEITEEIWNRYPGR